MYLGEHLGERGGPSRFGLLDDADGVLCETAKIHEIAEFISEERPDIAEELTHQYEGSGTFTGSDEITIELSSESMKEFLKVLSACYYADNVFGILNVDEY